MFLVAFVEQGAPLKIETPLENTGGLGGSCCA